MRDPRLSDQRPAAIRRIAPPIWVAPRTAPAADAVNPRSRCRYNTAKARIADCVAKSAHPPQARRQIRPSRNVGRRLFMFSGPWRMGRPKTAPVNTTASTHGAAMVTNAQCIPAALAIRGNTSATASPPSGVPAWRIPTASPRRLGGNQRMSDAPVAGKTAAVHIPVTSKANQSVQNVPDDAAKNTPPAAPDRPTVTPMRSPKRSTKIPHGIRTVVMPAFTAASKNPTCPRVRL